ncbi:hypothetical protein BKA67DRAFT_658011 [Truncatella angustata]|uniref:Rhodopsin domain-containing protein n=1 Tax=Truncatella angustata TaxID=152316 RepID=A0A9P8UNU9_9PEZI|nr:uncharacterized protein BKA67DRAFT_658011 [Truncatella angustata]KAH6656129.1 hypothetical protein BKA67DRAFT_658011 [Truncatella angustata]
MADISGLPDFGDITLLDHSRQGWKAVVVIVVCTTLATLCVCLRTYTRKVVINELWVDDYLAIFSNILLVGQAVSEGIQVRDGVGTHLWDVMEVPGALTRYSKMEWVGLLIYNIVGLFIKLMFFFQYYRIVRNVPRLKLIYTVIMSLVVIWCAAQILVSAFTCIPIAALWDPSVTGVCNPIGPDAQFYMASIGNIVTDVVILILPIPVVWRLSLRRPQKMVLFVVFGLGFFTCFISTFRVIFLHRPVDFTYGGIDVLCWSHAELASGIICASIPTLKALVGRYFPTLGTTRRVTTGYQRYDYSSRGKEFASPRSADLSTKDTGIYGLADLELGLDRPHPVSIETKISVMSKHSPKASLPISVNTVTSRLSDASVEDMSAKARITRSHSGFRRASQEIRVQKEWTLSNDKA